MKRVCIVFLAGLIVLISGIQATASSPPSATADSPESIQARKNREFVYGLALANGEHYTASFSPQKIDAVYGLADYNNAITARHTDVYFWALTGEYMADWDGYNRTLSGKLEILRGNRIYRTLSRTPFALEYEKGYQGPPGRLLVGEAAERSAAGYQARLEAYNRALEEYYRQRDAYQRAVQNYLGAPRDSRSGPPVEPQPPEQPAESPVNLDQGFIVNLPAGEYTIRFRDDTGKLVAGSERKWIAFAGSRQGIGYEITPWNRWTRPFRSADLAEGWFVRGSRPFFLKPFRTALFNSHHYAKLTNLPSPGSGRGMENGKTWAPMGSLPKSSLTVQILANGKIIREIREKPYLVKQHPGSALGYEIVEHRPAAGAPEEPSLVGYRIEPPPRAGNRSYTVRLVNSDGTEVPGSRRLLTVITGSKEALLWTIALFPLFLGAVAGGIRLLQNRRSGSLGGKPE